MKIPSSISTQQFQNKNGVSILFHIQPNSSKNQVVGQHGDRIKLKLMSPPVDGKANECLIEFLSEIFEISKSKIKLLRGETSREKTVFIEGLTIQEANEKLINL